MPPNNTATALEYQYSSPLPAEKSLTRDECDIAITNFSQLLKYPTISAIAPHDGSYTACAKFLIEQLESIKCFAKVFILDESPSDSPVVVAKWEGGDNSLPALLLNSHYDVVPITDESVWSCGPFSGEILDNKMYGRGVQDMKCVCIQYIEAVRKLWNVGFKPKRSIYLTFVPDEEIGGAGMAAFLESDVFKSEIGGPDGIALALDEGLASEDDVYSVFYGERLPWWIKVTSTGPTGHGSRFIPNTAVEQLIAMSNKALAFRNNQRDILHENENVSVDHSNCSHALVAKKTRQAIRDKKPNLGDVTSLNITTLHAGVKSGNGYALNCVPPIATANMDIRISPHIQPSEVSNMLTQWCEECSLDKANGSEVKWDFIPHSGNSSFQHALTSTDVKVNPYYQIFCDAMHQMKYKFMPQVFPAATDSRFLRLLGIRALGFSPMRNSDILLHENNECLDVNVFLEGVHVYIGLIEVLATKTVDI